MEFRVLGPLEVEGAPALGGGRQRAMLARLLLSANEAVSAPDLVDAVWDERPPGGAARSLEVYASRLRKLIAHTGAEILRRGAGYELVLGQARVDAHVFRELTDTARRALAAGQAAEARSTLVAALGLWRGPALADVPGSPGEALDELRVGAREDLAEAGLALGLHAELVPELEQLVREQPLRERSRSQLMLALYRSGRQADALDVYREGREALDKLGLEPGTALRELERDILRQDAALAAPTDELRQRRHLPSPATALVGRRAEIDELTAVLRGETRLLTLTGAGGIGKTRLAVQVAHDLADAFAAGVWFVGLAPLAEHAFVEATVAEALGLRDAPLERHLADRQLLLVLDNFEHVLEAGPLVSRLLAAAPQLKVLVTSRSRLNLYGERDYPVPPLAAEEASMLFLERAQAARHGFVAGPGIDELCRRFDRLPLALELVAARARDLTLSELLDAAELDLAAGGPRDLPERQQTLRAAISWSEDRLEDDERRVFASLGVFAGGFEANALEAVSPGAHAHLPALVDAALVHRGIDGRLRMLATVREYARERLDAGAADEVRVRHLAHFSRLAEELAPRLLGEGDADAHATLERERDNLRAALDFARRNGDTESLLALVRDLSRFWYVHGNLEEGAGWAEAAFAGSSPERSLLRAQALKGAALLDWRRGDLARAEARADEARAAIEAHGDESELLGALSIQGAVAYTRGDLTRAQASFEAGAALAERLGQLPYLSIALNNLAGIHYEAESWSESRRAYEASIAAARAQGSKELEAFAALGLGAVSLNLDELELAEHQLLDALALFRELGFPDRVASCCSYLSAVVLVRGDHLAAAQLLGAAAGLRDTSASTTDRVEQARAEETRSAAEAALGQETFLAAYESGAARPADVVQQVFREATSTLGA